MAVSRRKQLALDALRCPVRRALHDAWAVARVEVWRRTSAGRILFSPDGAVDKMREELGRLVREKVLEWWAVEVEEGWLQTDWHLAVKFTYRANGLRSTGTERFKVW